MAASAISAKPEQAVDVAAVLGLSAPLSLTGVALDSRVVAPGWGFVALQGGESHGLSYLDQALNRGASAVIVEAGDPAARGIAASLPAGVPLVAVPALRDKLGELARAVFGDVDQCLALVGVTGTDGKTSITHFVAQLLGAAGRRAAVLGTVGNGFLGQLQRASHTTADVFQVYARLAECAAQGAGSVAMEVSSHALDQRRTDGLRFEVAVLSNLGSDHLDYHGDVASYAAAKALLFDARARHCVLNLDDAFGRELAARRPDALGYSAAGDTAAAWCARDAVYGADGIELTVEGPGVSRRLQLSLMGGFNVANVLAACAVAELMGEEAKHIVARLPALSPVDGRAELLRSAKGSRVVLDYAHTAQALEAVLGTLRAHFASRIWCVFGCGGDRDPGKRPQMARAAERVADRVVITSDNPRGEDPQRIVDDVLTGIENPAAVHVELDRAAAIAYALSQAAPEDCVLIAGKGHEDYQVLADRTISFSDREQVLSWREAGA